MPGLNGKPCQMNSLHELLQDHVGRVYTSAAVEVRRQGAVRFQAAYGVIDAAGKDTCQPARVSTAFDLASLTKLFTTTVFLRLVDAGKIGLDDRVCAVLPAFKGFRAIRPYPNPLVAGESVSVVPPTGQTIDAAAVTFKQLLTHSSGLPAWLDLRERESATERMGMCLSTPFAYPTGSQAVYSDIGFILLGKAIERIVDLPLDIALQTWATSPLGLTVRYGKVTGNVAPTEHCPWRQRRLIGEVHDDNAAVLGGIAGHAGLFGTASDVAALGQMYLDGGAGLIGRDSVEDATRTHIGDRGLGWMKQSPGGSSTVACLSPESYGHTGFTGTSLWVDPRRKLVCALLTNRVFFGRNGAAIADFRRQFHESLVSMMAE